MTHCKLERSTFHGYCKHLLHAQPGLRDGLTENFQYFPSLPSLIKRDWETSRNVSAAPKFINLLRQLSDGVQVDFYMNRSNYYDSVGFDDSVFRVYKQLSLEAEEVKQYGIVLVDEYQDFNLLEASFIALLGSRNPIVIAGDDDQALYNKLRGSSPEHIRDLHKGNVYQPFELPFCMRCTEVVVGAVDDIVKKAANLGKLQGRISKRYEYYPPRKKLDSQKYPRLREVQFSTQSNKANYFGRYIEQQIGLIPTAEISESREGHFPTVLVVGPKQYLGQIRQYLDRAGFQCEIAQVSGLNSLEQNDGFRILHENAESNLGWRVLLEVERPDFYIDVVKRSTTSGQHLVQLIPSDYRKRCLEKLQQWREEPDLQSVAADLPSGKPTIKLTSFEGSKGLSAQHVFIIGLQEGEMPRRSTSIDDQEICRLIVALTRTRKQCHLMYTYRWNGKAKKPSTFLGWINARRKQVTRVDRTYWKT